jgi:FkbM family methyltransferase
MNFWEKIHFWHRDWRYRLISEKFGVSFLLNSNLNGHTALDIRANRGIFSYWMHKKVGSNGKVIAFEPQPELNQELHALRNAFSLPRLEIAKVGLSSVSQKMKMYRPKNHWGGASVQTGASDESLEQFEVDVITLDSFLDHEVASSVRFIKCDVEGHEFDILQGGVETIKRGKPDILFECHDAMNPNCKPFELLHSIDYRGFCFFNRGMTPIENYGHLREKGRLHRKTFTDFVFVPEERSNQLL